MGCNMLIRLLMYINYSSPSSPKLSLDELEAKLTKKRELKWLKQTPAEKAEKERIAIEKKETKQQEKTKFELPDTVNQVTNNISIHVPKVQCHHHRHCMSCVM